MNTDLTMFNHYSNGDARTPQRNHFTLNVEAQEWFPANHRTRNSGQRRPRNIAQNRLHQIRNEITQIDTDFEYLQSIIASISVDPGHFEDAIGIFMQTLNIYLNSQEMMTRICDFIFSQAIEEASFRYNAARLCMLIQEDSNIFHNHLQYLCQTEVDKNIQQPGFALFLAEIYTHSRSSNWGMLYDVINKLISIGGDENIKTSCQALKLSGFNLESFNNDMMENLISLLESKKLHVQQNIISLIESVVVLKKNGWGYASASTLETNPQNPSPCFEPNIEELTEEEQQFLDSNLYVINFFNYKNDNADLRDMDDPDDLYDPEPEMDEEIQAAFKEFVKIGK